MKKQFFPAIKLTLVLLIVLSGIYPLVIWGFAKLTPQKGKGELIEANGKKYYSNIGQSFTEDKYFYSRPSAVNYNAAGSAGSNKGPSNADYLAIIQERIDSFLTHNPGIEKKDIPVDLVTASGSGLDPHISVAAAEVQVKRISKIRNIPEANLRELVRTYTEQPAVGPQTINVLQLNIALDKLN
ncbi:K(+)-transporting ATPase subunit C [Sediminibacterium goheungense]|uniref:Potassium-transporting ATPase KdpC subunit n=1 Tax=Sediminibacterium goheungense TaxID=1086393 RepID=A0A4R6J361_9BACT|nr:K(+)-transporting ATPase subunit C [Sediminibacterium goheungense]TDO29367.1 K+-transporting ATPase ATPase C chain [Sediminibacterium goheungense]